MHWQQGADVAFTIAQLITDKHFDTKANAFIVSYAAQYGLSQETCSIFVNLLKFYRRETLKEPL